MRRAIDHIDQAVKSLDLLDKESLLIDRHKLSAVEAIESHAVVEHLSNRFGDVASPGVRHMTHSKCEVRILQRREDGVTRTAMVKPKVCLGIVRRTTQALRSATA